MLFLMRDSRFNRSDAVKISPNESFFARLPNATVADIHAIGHDGSSNAAATCIVAALLDDVA